ncbi:DUF4148 domain-containing protein [Burkholderia sp. Ac-20379]|uniref:DUF4148 domain-containing protein n=1 Tax=Burkholderia sp. Ac-20379 TaxID=2703900 RepID=UPI00197D0D2B|nr:DUF4148 domain-containing protein [Burkholderia sp. Ac-20379]MBN3724611.1 DUF4148 domain-containing protein [Burkholderia sp. Ac-20379]
MNATHKAACLVLLIAISSVCSAAPVMTAQECHSYKASRANRPLTRADVVGNLDALEAAGYTPARGNDPYYPDDIQAAEKKLARMEVKDCGNAGYRLNASNMPS